MEERRRLRNEVITYEYELLIHISNGSYFQFSELLAATTELEKEIGEAGLGAELEVHYLSNK